MEAHSTGTDIERYVYPAQVREAVIMQALRLLQRREKNYGDNLAGLLESGQVGPMVRGLDADVRQMLGTVTKPRI